jgi:hypothetical protein
MGRILSSDKKVFGGNDTFLHLLVAARVMYALFGGFSLECYLLARCSPASRLTVRAFMLYP